MFILRITLLFIIPTVISASEVTQSMEEFMIEFNDKYVCSNNEYISCMKITKDICTSSFKKAFRMCDSQKRH